jgi:hypothetical protein
MCEYTNLWIESPTWLLLPNSNPMRYHGEVNIGLGLTREAKQRMGSLAGKISNQNTKNFSCVSDCKRSLLTDYLHLPPYPGQVGVFERAFACFKATRQVFVGSQANVSRLMSLTFGRNFLSWTDWTSRIAVNFNQLRGWGKLKTGPIWRHLGFLSSSFQSPYFFLREISLANCNR